VLFLTPPALDVELLHELFGAGGDDFVVHTISFCC
jgi:hypothetical protein